MTMADGCQASTRSNSEYPTLQEVIPAEYLPVFEKLVAAAKRNPSQGQRHRDLLDRTKCALRAHAKALRSSVDAEQQGAVPTGLRQSASHSGALMQRCANVQKGLRNVG
jgi:hypothetical protein